VVHLILTIALLLSEAAPIGLQEDRASYRVELRPDRRDYQLLSPPGPGIYTVRLEGDNPSGKSKLVFATPLPAGRYQLRVRPTRPDQGQTVVFSVPLAAGHSSFTVTAAGKARYDFVFHRPAGTEHRYTLTAPFSRKTFTLP
jgi:hypothetical protein